MYIPNKRYVANKLKKTQALLKNNLLATHIPPTKRFSSDTLRSMLRQHRMVYLKPVSGLKGRGIMRARVVGSKYELRQGKSIAVFGDLPSMFQVILSRIGRQPYVIQQGIHLLQYHGRSFDLRIMVLKNEAGRWEVAGIVGRVAPPRMIVTNRSQGGRIMPVRTLLRPHMKNGTTTTYLQSLYRLSRTAGQQFQQVYPKAWQLGVDIAVSQKLKPWILEVNTDPAITPFVKLGNKQMYRRIKQLKQVNRRRSYPL